MENIRTKICGACKEELPITSFHMLKGKYFCHICKVCENDARYKRYHQRRDEALDTGQVIESVPEAPNTYFSDIQREHVTEFLTLLGWRLNKTKNIWYKPGVKDENGEFKFLINKVKKEDVLSKEQLYQKEYRAKRKLSI